MAIFDRIDNKIKENLKRVTEDGIRQRIQAASITAMSVIEDAIGDNSELSAKDKAKIASQVLDRAGFRPADVVEHRLSIEGGLSIKVVHDINDPSSVPNVHVPKVIDHEPV
jgi:hypothetical protein